MSQPAAHHTRRTARTSVRSTRLIAMVRASDQHLRAVPFYRGPSPVGLSNHVLNRPERAVTPERTGLPGRVASYARWQVSRLDQVRIRWIRRRMTRRIRPYLAGQEFSFITQNCVGIRFSEWAADEYRSPTINLWFTPGDFLSFVEDLPRYLGMEMDHDAEESAACGYPVGRLGDIRVYCTHYATIQQAREQWARRAARTRLDRVIVVMHDRDGFTDQHLSRFAALAWKRKILITATPRLHPRAISVPGWAHRTEVDDTYGYVELLDPVLTDEVLRALTAPD